MKNPIIMSNPIPMDTKYNDEIRANIAINAMAISFIRLFFIYYLIVPH